MSNKDKPKFRNPLLQDSTKIPPIQSEDAIHHDEISSTPSFASGTKLSKKSSTFEQNHERMTIWLDIELKQKFDKLCNEEGKGARTRYINEAISDLLRKHKIK